MKSGLSVPVLGLIVLVSQMFQGETTMAQWEPPSEIPREEILATSSRIMALPDSRLKVREDIFRIQAVGLDWDIAAMVYEPEDESRIPRGPDGKKVGVFLIHGGAGDHRSMDRVTSQFNTTLGVARLLAGKFGFKVVSMSYPGRLYLLDPSRDWPGDTIKPDGSVRTPIWEKTTRITQDQYEVVTESSLRDKYGTITMACAREGTEFYNRMAGWPVAFETGGKDLMARHFPPEQYSIYIHGHSTGGPFAFMFSQRVSNIQGVLGMDTSPFGYISRVQFRPSGHPYGKTFGDLPFECLVVRTWRDIARYAGPEALMLEGPDTLMKLPSLVEDIFEKWERRKHLPNFKAEGMVHFGSVHSLSNAAHATAKRLGLSKSETASLVSQYINYSRELRGLDVKPVPPVLFGIAQASADHTAEKYRQVTLPMYAGMDPPPRVRLVQFRAGTHGYTTPSAELPMGVFPAVAELWREAIMEGYYLE